MNRPSDIPGKDKEETEAEACASKVTVMVIFLALLRDRPRCRRRIDALEDCICTERETLDMLLC